MTCGARRANCPASRPAPSSSCLSCEMETFLSETRSSSRCFFLSGSFVSRLGLSCGLICKEVNRIWTCSLNWSNCQYSDRGSSVVHQAFCDNFPRDFLDDLCSNASHYQAAIEMDLSIFKNCGKGAN